MRSQMVRLDNRARGGCDMACALPDMVLILFCLWRVPTSCHEKGGLCVCVCVRKWGMPLMCPNMLAFLPKIGTPKYWEIPTREPLSGKPRSQNTATEPMDVMLLDFGQNGWGSLLELGLRPL